MLRLLILGLMLGFLICYLEWGDRTAFLFQIEYDILTSGTGTFGNLAHPAIFLPFGGQLALLTALLQKQPSRRLIIAAIFLKGLLVLLILLGGILTMNVRTILSCLPFLFLSIYTLWRRRNISVGAPPRDAL